MYTHVYAIPRHSKIKTSGGNEPPIRLYLDIRIYISMFILKIGGKNELPTKTYFIYIHMYIYKCTYIYIYIYIYICICMLYHVTIKSIADRWRERADN